MSRSRVIVAALAAGLMSFAPAMAGAQQRAMAGTYKVAVSSPQGPIETVIKLAGANNAALTGTLDATGFPTIPVVHVIPSDTGFVAHADAGGETVTVTAKFIGADKVKGTLNYQGADMPMEGTFAADGAAAPAAGAAPVNPVGRYTGKTLDPFMGATEFPFECVISKSADRFGGGCGPSGQDVNQAPLESVTVNGSEITFAGSSPAGPYTGKMTVSGTSFTGTLSLNGETARIQGTVAPATR